VLFESGTSDLGDRGRSELAKFAAAFKTLMSELPDDLPWVLQVDGHTDRRPISTPRFPSNWELSTARAISVARYLVSEGIPSDRVAATGFAEFQPLDTGSTEDAYRRNRRIEIKLTTR
jgi:chemotaxis protein MotB